MPKVLIMGAGMVSNPLVRHVSRLKGYRVTVADQNLSAAQRVIGNQRNCRSIALNATDIAAVTREANQADIVVSILPPEFHVGVAKACLDANSHLVTTSYISPDMEALHEQFLQRGLLSLNGMGLDPGIDILSAMQIIHRTQASGGKITGFFSACGGLPAPEANNNPFGYKFAWTPSGVFKAMTNGAVYLRDGKQESIPADQLFANPTQHVFEEIGTLEAYPNRDSVSFIESFDLQGVSNMLRATFRYPGWCRFWHKAAHTGILSLDPIASPNSLRFVDLTSRIIGVKSSASVREAFAATIGEEKDSEIVEMAKWLGLFSTDAIPTRLDSPFAVIVHLAAKRMKYAKGERDMSAMQHVFDIETRDGTRQRQTSILVDYGIPNGDSSMARTVGLTAAIGAKLIAEGKITARGVILPTLPEIYNPAIEQLEDMGIKMEHRFETLDG
ncbi:MAG: saccharopine dehydrogenase NADP-binding domain-containing protein [Candidatus Margulisbacteria bacterium]|nr:saccharopine dehydrogenase NADP-binding domain-containing protein [Candidatus Margulisiibacteriota bacterium]MBU1021280.1 saccharopine dehydrogenase NADP-binding domain-containing protein [Candidatus Margulisiibacteriota bacterium]MBU1729231.1 saccharopine dehydrogenase NADP-binding domain-containing protein [Candidatus Margulisiibacteriota bacterium]MBU1954904.1 saccharopine dehydrogenase NADP-binding domain-containing protein [Candidatus Margulisiibacteriota bacterium]